MGHQLDLIQTALSIELFSLKLKLGEHLLGIWVRGLLRSDMDREIARGFRSLDQIGVGMDKLIHLINIQSPAETLVNHLIITVQLTRH